MIELTKRALLGAAFAAPLAALPATSHARVIDNGGRGLSLHQLDVAIDAHPRPGALIMDRWMRNMLSAGSRNLQPAGFITWDCDHNGYRRAFYNDLPIYTPPIDNRQLGPRPTLCDILVIPALGPQSTDEIDPNAIVMIRHHPLTVALTGIASLTPVR